MNTLWRPNDNLLKFPLSLEHFWLFCYWLFWFVWLFGITNLEEKNLEFQIIWKERYLLEIKILNQLLEAIQGVLKILTSIKKLQWAIYRYVNLAQRPRTDLNKRFLPRPNTTIAWKLMPHRSNISKIWNPSHCNYCKAVFVLVKINFWKIYVMGPNVWDFNSCWFKTCKITHVVSMNKANQYLHPSASEIN